MLGEHLLAHSRQTAAQFSEPAHAMGLQCPQGQSLPLAADHVERGVDPADVGPRRVWEAGASDSPPETLNPLHRPGRWKPYITQITALSSGDTHTGTLEILEPRP
jgi:hypothetical protein